MNFPCIIYNWSNVDDKFADNFNYHPTKCYQVTYVDKNPDSNVPDKIGELTLSSFERRFVADNLYHTVYSVYF